MLVFSRQGGVEELRMSGFEERVSGSGHHFNNFFRKEYT
jgi:hypothetical protein